MPSATWSRGRFQPSRRGAARRGVVVCLYKPATTTPSARRTQGADAIDRRHAWVINESEGFMRR